MAIHWPWNRKTKVWIAAGLVPAACAFWLLRPPTEAYRFEELWFEGPPRLEKTERGWERFDRELFFAVHIGDLRVDEPVLVGHGPTSPLEEQYWDERSEISFAGHAATSYYRDFMWPKASTGHAWTIVCPEIQRVVYVFFAAGEEYGVGDLIANLRKSQWAETVMSSARLVD